MVNSAVMMAEKQELPAKIDIIPSHIFNIAEEEISISLRSLQSLLESIAEDGEEKTGKTKKTKDKKYGEKGIKNFFYGDDDENIYKNDDEDEEEEYPTASDEDQERIKELAKKSVKNARTEQTDEQMPVDVKGYKRPEPEQRIMQMAYQNSIAYPSDRAFQSIIIENSRPTDVYHSLLDTATTHNLRVEARSYELWGDGGMYIESINGVKNGQDGYFWEYIVNGKIPDISVDKFQLQSGDLIEWRRLKKEEIKC